MVRVLVVDDYPGIANALYRFIRVLGHEAHAVYCGSDAIALANKLQPDLVLLDMKMPDLTGSEVARALRTRLSRIYIATMSTHSGTDMPDADEHVLKPFGLADLSALIDRVERFKQSQLEA